MKKIMMTTTAMALLLSAGQSLAQTVAPAGSAPGNVSATPPPTGANAIQEVVVTAQHRSENLQKAALSVNAVDAKALKDANVIDPQDLTKLIPALQLSALGGGGTQVNIRGVGNFAPFIYNDPAVAINYDGVYLARSAAPNGLFFDLNRVEVLKGPQGTLYGRNATGGAINIITNKPDLTHYSVSGDLELGNYNLVRGSLAVNLPLSDIAALRISTQAVDRDGYLSDGYSDDVGQAVRTQLLVKPTDKLKIDLEADYIHQGGKGPGAVFVTPAGFVNPKNPYQGPSSPASNALLTNASLGLTGGADPNLLPQILDDGRDNLNITGASATIDYDLGFADLTFIPAYRRTDNKFLHYDGGYPISSSEHSEQSSFELRLASARPSKLKWVVGAYYFDDDSRLDDNVQQGVTFALDHVPSLPVKSAAAFAQATYSITDRFRITGGVRYTHEEKQQTGAIVTELPPVPAGFPAPPIVFYTVAACPSPAVLNVPANSCTASFHGDLTSSKTTGKIGLEYDAAPNSLLFASVETGFKAGGFYPSAAPNTYKPEEITAYTFGSKNRFLENSLQVNLEVFYWKYDDMQVTHLGAIRPAGYSLITENAGQATIAGAELDIQWRPTRTDRFGANLQYVYSNYDQFTYMVPLLSGAPNAQAATTCPQSVSTSATGVVTATVNCSGKPLPQSPQEVLNLSYAHTFPLSGGDDVEGIVGSKIQSAYFTGDEYLPGERQSPSTVSYASVTYHPPARHWSIGAYVENIENEAVKSSSFVQPTLGVPLVVLRPPRTYGVRLGFDF